MRRLALTFTVLSILGAPAAASAQAEAGSPAAQAAQVPSPATPTPAPVPVAGKVKIGVQGGVSTKRTRFAAHGQSLRVVGRARPFVAGQVAVLELRRGKKRVGVKRARIKRSKKGTGVAVFKLKMRRRGDFTLRIRHRATPRQKAFGSKKVRLHSGIFRAGSGSKGTPVQLLQRELARMGYAVSQSGRYDAGTERAVLAYRKTNGFSRVGYATPKIFSLVFQGRGAFRVRYKKAGRHVEFDWSRQVLALIDKGRPKRVYHASSGAPSTPTVFGSYRFYRKQPGTNEKGMVDSNYFIRGYAIHGYSSVPNYAASHGCIRVPVPNADDIDRQLSLGERIFVYH